MFQAAYRISGSSSDAEDVLQTVFLRLLRRGDGSAGEGLPRLEPNPEGYLHRAAVNAALDLVRARARARSVPVFRSKPTSFRPTMDLLPGCSSSKPCPVAPACA